MVSVIEENNRPDGTIPTDDKKYNKNKPRFEDNLINSLESICNIFDNIYFLKSLGIISENNFIYRSLNKGNLGSKFWFITLILSLRKLSRQSLKAFKVKRKISKELKSIINDNEINENKNLLNNVLIEKFNETINNCNSILKNNFFELVQTLLYLMIVCVEIFKLKLSKKFKNILETASNFITVIRFLTLGFTTSQI